jgi:hypothetical protein
MKRRGQGGYLEEQIALLVRHFGSRQVVAALEPHLQEPPEVVSARKSSQRRGSVGSSIPVLLDRLGKEDGEKRELLKTFYEQMGTRILLPESQDILQFAQVVGLKSIEGRSRRDLVPKLMRFLIAQPVEQLRNQLAKAADISETHRRAGYSVLTDKLIGR